MYQIRAAAANDYFKGLSSEDRQLLEWHVAGLYMTGQGGVAAGSDAYELPLFRHHDGTAEEWNQLDKLVRRAPCGTQDRVLYRGALAYIEDADIDMYGPFSTSTQSSVAKDWTQGLQAQACDEKKNEAKEKGLMPCLMIIHVASGVPVFDAGLCMEFIRSSEHKTALLLQQEAVLASGKLIFRQRRVQEAGGKRKRGAPPSLPMVEFDYRPVTGV